MSESFAADIQDLWSLYQSQKTLVEAIQEVLISLANGQTPDYSSLSNAGMAGSESQSEVTWTDRLDKAVERMLELRRLAIAASPGYGVMRLPRRTCNG